jgi:molybdenum cofactor cytidylyltransferase
MTLPWGDATILRQVMKTIVASVGDKIEYEILIITGGWKDDVEKDASIFLPDYPIKFIFNPHYEKGMLTSIQIGLSASHPQSQAALIGLGDQPQVRKRTVTDILRAYRNTHQQLIVPSFQGRRGHPWLVARPLWSEILKLDNNDTPRQFLNLHANEILYVDADESILLDVDTPEEYRRQKPV